MYTSFAQNKIVIVDHDIDKLEHEVSFLNDHRTENWICLRQCSFAIM
jgi:hypothetical protein